MKQPLPPPIQPKRPKDKSKTAIFLAVLLHVLIAIVVYFAIFNNKQSSKIEDTLLINERPTSISIIKGDQQQSSELLRKQSTITDSTTQPTSDIPNNKTVSDTAKKTVNTNNDVANKNSGLEKASRLTSNNKQALTESAINSQQNPPEYKLKQTTEYQQLDEEIDQDSEQLAKLIGEVKKRNQQQINQQQAVMSSDQSKPATVTDDSTLKYDYPITPITSLNDNQDDN